MKEANNPACSQVTWGNVVHEHCNAKPAEHEGFWHLWKYRKAALSINMYF